MHCILQIHNAYLDLWLIFTHSHAKTTIDLRYHHGGCSFQRLQPYGRTCCWCTLVIVLLCDLEIFPQRVFYERIQEALDNTHELYFEVCASIDVKNVKNVLSTAFRCVAHLQRSDVSTTYWCALRWAWSVLSPLQAAWPSFLTPLWFRFRCVTCCLALTFDSYVFWSIQHPVSPLHVLVLGSAHSLSSHNHYRSEYHNSCRESLSMNALRVLGVSSLNHMRTFAQVRPLPYYQFRIEDTIAFVCVGRKL